MKTNFPVKMLHLTDPELLRLDLILNLWIRNNPELAEHNGMPDVLLRIKAVRQSDSPHNPMENENPHA